MGSPFTPSNYTVLVVDSDPQICADLTALLERVGYRTRTYDSGEALLQSLNAIPEPACVIAEVELPGMTGLELVSRLRQNNVAVPIMILTRLGDVAVAVRAMRDRVADYLTKPYVDRDLVMRLQNALLRGAEVPAH